MNRILVLLILMLLAGCDYLQELREKNQTKNQTPIARVYDKMLYKEDIKGLITNQTITEDSADIVNRYVDSWVKRQLLLHAAETNTTLDEAEVNRRVEEYRYDLLVYAYERRYIEEHLDTAVSAERIQSYYQENKDNFQLRQNIVKGVLVKVSSDARRLNGLKRWMSREPITKNLDDIKEYALQIGGLHHLTDTVWADFEDVIANTPFITELTNRIQAVKSKRLLETSDENYTYFLRVLDYKLSSDVSPLSFVEDQIRDIIVNKRKMELRRKHEKEIKLQAEKNKEYEVYK